MSGRGPSATAQSQIDRQAYAQSMRDAGYTLEEIGGVLGVTRERVRQITTKALRGSNTDSLAILAAIRDPSIITMGQLSVRVGHHHETVSTCIAALGLSVAVHRLLRWRRTFPTRQRYAAAIRHEYERLGRTPTCLEIAAKLNIAPTSGCASLHQVFGSQIRAMQYVGIEPRRAGSPGHIAR